MKEDIHMTKVETEELKQNTRKENVKIFGLTEDQGEDLVTKVVSLARDINVELKPEDISICHRLHGNGKQPRPVILRFLRREMKTKLMQGKKKKLRKNSNLRNIYITDDLTQIRNKIVRSLRDDPDVQRVWTIDGKINCITLDETGNQKKKW